MKKLFSLIIIILFIIFGYLYLNHNDIKKDKDYFLSIIEEELGSITDYYIYGNHLNIEGNVKIDDDITNYKLVLKNKSKEYELDCTFEKDNNLIKFKTSNLINKGINLDKLNKGTYYLFVKDENNKFYALKNKTNYTNLEYYTITNNHKNNIINFNVDKYVKLIIKESKLPSEVYDITIDPGHGGIDTGCNYKYNGENYYESNITLDIALKVKKELENNGFKVKLTRESDIDLDYYNESGRAVIPNKYHTKLCISIHVNSEKNMNYGGVEVYTPNDIDYNLAQVLANNLSSINGYSKKIDNKVLDGVYFDAFTKESIIEANKENVKIGLKEYDIEVSAPKMYMIREVGGRVTHAYQDGRNEKYGLNPYYNSNQVAESYLVELGYITYLNDLDKLINNKDSFSKMISKGIIDFYK